MRKIDIYVRSDGKVSYWGSTTRYQTCKAAIDSVPYGTPGPTGIQPGPSDTLVARFDKRGHR